MILCLKNNSYFPISKDADYLISSVLPTVARFKVLDFPASWYEGTNQCLVPYPKKELNTAATIKPFALEVNKFSSHKLSFLLGTTTG